MMNNGINEMDANALALELFTKMNADERAVYIAGLDKTILDFMMLRQLLELVRMSGR